MANGQGGARADSGRKPVEKHKKKISTSIGFDKEEKEILEAIIPGNRSGAVTYLLKKAKSKYKFLNCSTSRGIIKELGGVRKLFLRYGIKSIVSVKDGVKLGSRDYKIKILVQGDKFKVSKLSVDDMVFESYEVSNLDEVKL